MAQLFHAEPNKAFYSDNVSSITTGNPMKHGGPCLEVSIPIGNPVDSDNSTPSPEIWCPPACGEESKTTEDLLEKKSAKADNDTSHVRNNIAVRTDIMDEPSM